MTPEQIQAMKDRMANRPPAGVDQSFTKNTEYDPNNPASKRYIPSTPVIQTTGATGATVTPPAGQPPQGTPPVSPQVTPAPSTGVSSTPEGIKAAFGEGWQPADIFKEKGLTDQGIQGAVRIKGLPEVYTIGQGGKWIETPEEYKKLFGTNEQAGIVGEITPEQAKLLGIKPEGVAELKASRQKDEEMKNLFDMAQKAGLSWDDTMKLINSQNPVDTEKIRNDLGIPDVIDKLFQMPDKTIQEIYQEAYDKSELPGLKDKIGQIDADIKKAREDLATATGQINGNPWISESSRVGKMRILNKRAEETISNLENQRSQYMDIYDKGADELEGFMLRYNKQYKNEKDLLADQFNYLIGESERRATEAKAKRESENLRYMPEFLKARAEEGVKDRNTKVVKMEDGSQILIDTDTGEQIQSYGGVDNVDKGIVGGYDISKYATDPNHEAAVSSILQKIGKFNNWEDMDAYIQQVAPDSPITAEMIGKASEEFGVSWEMMVAMMQQDSSLGTKGKGARTFNPGNVGNDDTGREVNYGDWQSGVNAVAKWLSKHKVKEGAGGIYPETSVFNYNEKLDVGKIPKLGGKQITNKTARGSNLPYGITDKQADWVIEHRLGNVQFQQLKSKGVKSLNDLVELREDINQIRELKKKINTGPVASRLARGKRYAGWENSDFNQLEIKSGKQLADFIKSISGAAVSEQEAQRLAKLVPNVGMQDNQFIDALNDFEDGLNGLISAKIMQYDLGDEETLKKAIRGENIGDQTSSGTTSSGMGYTVE